MNKTSELWYEYLWFKKRKMARPIYRTCNYKDDTEKNKIVYLLVDMKHTFLERVSNESILPRLPHARSWLFTIQLNTC